MAPQDTGPFVRLADVSRTYGHDLDEVRAADGASLDVAGGEFVCLQGASGSGKSTLLNLISGLDVPNSGAVEVCGTEIHGLSETARAEFRLARIGVVFQEHNLLGELSAVENVALPLLARGRSAKSAHAEAGAALDRVGLSGLHARRPAQLSGGQRQRVGIARGLVGERSVLVADEPTGALDSANSCDLFALLRTLADEQGVAIVMATHDPLALEYASRAVTVVDGRVSEG